MNNKAETDALMEYLRQRGLDRADAAMVLTAGVAALVAKSAQGEDQLETYLANVNEALRTGVGLAPRGGEH